MGNNFKLQISNSKLTPHPSSLIFQRWHWGLLVPFVLAACGLAVAAFFRSLAPVNSRDPEPVTITISSGAAAGEIAHQLHSTGVIRSAVAFRLAAGALRYDRRFQVGTYLLKPSMSARQIMEIIASGKTAKKKVTIPEGLTSREIAHRLEASGVCTAQSFLRAVENPPAHLKLPFRLDHSLEGFLFPDTYLTDVEVSTEQVLGQMVEQFVKQVWEPDQKEIETSGLSVHQIVILASLVEREAQVAEERPLIAQVYLRRLSQGMRLECDATVQFALGEWKQRLTYRDLSVDSPYNTYRHGGLPPGPICNPGRACIEAVLRPAKTDYLYYVAVGDGRHYFSRTFAEHEAAQRK